MSAFLAFVMVGSSIGGCLSAFAAGEDSSAGQAVIPFDKSWDRDGSSGELPESIEVSLYKYSGDFEILVETTDVTGPNWHYDFDISNEALLDSSGNVYQYKIVETPIESYSESEHVDPTVGFVPVGVGEWEEHTQCSELDITGTPNKNPIVAAEKGNRVIIWTEIPLTPAERDAIHDSLAPQHGIGNPRYEYISGFGSFSDYGIEEVSSSHIKFKKKSSWSIVYFGEYVPTSTSITPASITNKYKLAKSLTIKKTFSGVSADALKNLTFTITGPEKFGTNGEKTISFSDDCEVSEDEATCIIDESIYLGDYTIKENNANLKHFQLTTTIDEPTITATLDADVVFEIDNEYVVDTTTYTVTKIWDDDHDRDGVRPDQLTINLLGTEREVVDTKELPDGYESEDVWTYTFKDLPVANKDAEEIDYSASEVLEESEDGYTKTNEIINSDSATFTNTHLPELVNNNGKIKVTKIWDDGDNLLGIRPNGIFVTLLANGEEYASTTIRENEDGEWVYTFEGLYKYSEGSEIEYSIEEGALSTEYSSKIEGDVENGFVITNKSTNPCSFGGCGKGGEIPEIPDTGRFTSSDGVATEEGSIITVMIGGIAVLMMSLGLLIGKHQRHNN